MSAADEFSDFEDLLIAEVQSDEPAIPEFGIRIVVCLDEDGKQSVRWKKHGDSGVANHISALEQVKFLLLLEDAARYPGITIPEDDDEQ